MMRIGQGFDIHAMLPWEAGASSRLMRLGGVDIPSDFRLQGHSDADALLHAITDALLGAGALGDIGRHFPDTDVAWKGADSRKLLVHCVQLVTRAGWCIENVDATVITQIPKIAPHAMAMTSAIASLLAIDKTCVSVKAKTAENLGFVGRKEGLAVMAVALLSQ